MFIQSAYVCLINLTLGILYLVLQFVHVPEYVSFVGLIVWQLTSSNYYHDWNSFQVETSFFFSSSTKLSKLVFWSWQGSRKLLSKYNRKRLHNLHLLLSSLPEILARLVCHEPMVLKKTRSHGRRVKPSFKPHNSCRFTHVYILRYVFNKSSNQLFGHWFP